MYNILPRVKALGKPRASLCRAGAVSEMRIRAPSAPARRGVTGPMRVDWREERGETQVTGFLGSLQSERVGALP